MTNNIIDEHAIYKFLSPSATCRSVMPTWTYHMEVLYVVCALDGCK